MHSTAARAPSSASRAQVRVNGRWDCDRKQAGLGDSYYDDMLVGNPLSKQTSRMFTKKKRLWCLKMAVFDLLARIISKMPYERYVVYGFWTLLFSTFIASVITVFVGCRPFERHWQIYPDPGDWYGRIRSTTESWADCCSVVGNAWLITYETSNIVTDLMLMALPFTLICSVTIPMIQ